MTKWEARERRERRCGKSREEDAMMITGEWMAKFENRVALIHDQSLFAVKTARDVKIDELENKYQAKFIQGELKEDAMYCLMKWWGDVNIEVNVWNCQAQVIYRGDDGSLIDYECDAETEDKLDELAYNSVYDAGGAINMSGLYPPCEELIRFFSDSIKSGKIILMTDTHGDHDTRK